MNPPLLDLTEQDSGRSDYLMGTGGDMIRVLAIAVALDVSITLTRRDSSRRPFLENESMEI